MPRSREGKEKPMWTLHLIDWDTGQREPADKRTTRKLVKQWELKGVFCVFSKMDAIYVFEKE